MMSSNFQRVFALVLLAVLPLFAMRGDEVFFGNKHVDFEALGYPEYQLTFSATIIVGGDAYAYANSGFGSLHAQSYSYIGEAFAEIYIYGIRKTSGVWKADNVVIRTFSNFTGQDDYVYHYNYTLPSAGWVTGSAYCDGQSQEVCGQLLMYGAPVPAPPQPSVAVSGYSSGQSVPAGSSINVHFSATDVNHDLSGIRFNTWYRTPAESQHQNNGGTYVSQSGGSGLVTQSLSLTYSGHYYFWTEAIDAAAAQASTPAWINAFHIFVPWRTPCYDFAYWNALRFGNNCYNYATNRITNTSAQPGTGGGVIFNLHQPDDNQVIAEIRAAAKADGLIPEGDPTPIEPGMTKVALAINPQVDFHWYRQDCDGTWSHKIGDHPPSNRDNSGNIILNPQSADRGAYTVFGGYFYAPSDAIPGAGHANIL